MASRPYNEEDLLLLSGIQHFKFCPRQWALIHVEQQWQENVLTAKGHIFHELAHEGRTDKRSGLIVSRGLQIVSYQLGLRGQCDVVEWHMCDEGVPIAGRDGLWLPMPIEYKRGKQGFHTHADELQLCAQAICLEHMCLCRRIESAQLYYGENRWRFVIELTDELRKEVCKTVLEMHQYFERGYTPKVKPTKACRNCSLADICLPSLMKRPTVSEYMSSMLGDGT